MSQAEHDRQMDYIEFPATDIEATKRFYGQVFGWTFTDYGPGYTSFNDRRLGGGFLPARNRGSGRGQDARHAGCAVCRVAGAGLCEGQRGRREDRA